MEAEEILKAVTTKDVITIMEEHGAKLYKTGVDSKTKQNILWFKTICHGGNSHKLCYFTDSKDFFCYTNCGRMTFFNFIKKIMNLEDDSKSFYQVLKYVAKKIGYIDNRTRDRNGISLISLEEKKDILSDLNTINKIIKSKELKDNNINKPESKIFDSSILNYFQKVYYEGWIKEGISIQSMEKYNIRWYEFQKHIIIPHLDKNGNLIGIRRRSLKLEDQKRKYMPEYIEGISYEHSLGLNLYGLYYNQKAIKKYKRAIIVEAEKSVLLSDTFYGDKSITVATCGFNITDYQIELLIQLGVNDITIAFDKDFDFNNKEKYLQNKEKREEFKRYKEKLLALGEKINYYCNAYLVIDLWNILEEKDSPYDKGKENFELLLKNRIYISDLEYM